MRESGSEAMVHSSRLDEARRACGIAESDMEAAWIRECCHRQYDRDPRGELVRGVTNRAGGNRIS